MYGNRSDGAIIGFISGLMTAGSTMVDLTATIVARSTTGFVLGFFNNLELKPTPGVAFATTFAATVFQRLLLLFLAPPPEIWPYLKATIGSGLYNAIIAVPTYMILSTLMGTTRR
jgi:hypothetical protein